MLRLQGGSSDVYVYSLDKRGPRTLQLVVTPTGAGDIYVEDDGWEAFVSMCLWEQIPYEIRYRTELKEKRDAPFGRASAGGLDLTKFKTDQMTPLTDVQRQDFDVFAAWRALSDDEKQVYIDASNIEKAAKTKIWMDFAKSQGYPPIVELSVNDICGNMGDVAWRYVQNVTYLGSDGLNRDQLEEKYGDERLYDHRDEWITKRFRVTLTHPRYMPADSLSDSTTNYPQRRRAAPVWSPQVHWRFPLAFQLRALVVLMARNRKGNPMATLNLGITLIVLRHLAASAYDEVEENEWEQQFSSSSPKNKRIKH